MVVEVVEGLACDAVAVVVVAIAVLDVAVVVVAVVVVAAAVVAVERAKQVKDQQPWHRRPCETLF